jgi:membrane fusion protein, multidrug efflux system
MKRTLWIVAFLAVVGGFAGFQQYQSWSLNKKPQDDATAKPASGESGSRAGGRRGGGEAVPVVVATAVQKSVPVQLRAVGNVEAFNTVSVKSQVTGVLQKAHFKEGQDVKLGQLLFTIDARPLEAALKQAEATLARDSAQYKNKREQLKRYAELVEKQYVSREQYDQIKADADAAEAVVDSDKAAVENAKVQLSYCYIYSPVNGRVGSLLINEGNLVRVNDGAPLVVINQVTPINVTFAVPEQHLIDIKRHMASHKLNVSASFPSGEGRPEQGILTFVDNAVDRTTGTIKLKAEFTNNERRLWPGQFINVALTLTTEADAVVIPSEAIQVGPDGQQVFIVKQDKRVELRPVSVGQTNEGESVITKGLAAGEQVVREGQFLLSPGSRVDIKDTARVAGETKGEGRRGGGRGKAKSDGEGKETASAGDPVKTEGRGERKVSAETGDAGKSSEETSGEARRKRRGDGKTKSDGDAGTKSAPRSDS